MADELFVEYFVPINSRAEIDGEFLIEGIAINETTTSNGHTFLGDELRNSATTLIGVPLLKDHINSVDSIVGRVKGAHFDETSRNIPFKAVVKDAKMKQMVKDGLINSVSVGAHVDPKNIEEGTDGNIIPHNIIFKEISLVAVPADAGATFGVALNNAWKGLKEANEGTKKCPDCGKMIPKADYAKHTLSHVGKPKTEESQSNNKFENTERRDIQMSEETIKSDIVETAEPKLVEAKVDEKLETKTEIKEAKVEVNYEEKIKALDEKIAKLESANKKVTESEDEEATVKEKDYSIIEGHRSFSYQMNKYN